MLTINVVGTPAPQGSHRGFVVNGRAVVTQDNKKTKPWRQAVSAAANEQMLKPMAEGGQAGAQIGPVEVTIEFYMPRPGYHYGTGRNAGVLKPTAPTYVEKKPDVDKLVRSTLDALTDSGVFRDDAQVARLSAVKRYADAATGARITIIPLNSSSAVPLTPAAGEAPTTEGVLW
jgi:Holliday junction resolvase RusA-like endonuclease